MKIHRIKGRGDIYTSNVYYVTGDWKGMQDVNTLIDVGADPSLIAALEQFSGGVGKKKVEQVILTHGHSDHAAMLPRVKETYNPIARAFSQTTRHIDQLLKHGDAIPIGDRIFEIIHLPTHSEDSICLYNSEEGVLFAGDTPLNLKTGYGYQDKYFLETLRTLCRKNIQSIYFGHGEPMIHNASEMLVNSLNRIELSQGILVR